MFRFFKQKKLKQTKKVEQEIIEKERLKMVQAEKQRLENKRLKDEQEKQEQLEKEMFRKEKLQQERLEKEKLEKQRLESEKLKRAKQIFVENSVETTLLGINLFILYKATKDTFSILDIEINIDDVVYENFKDIYLLISDTNDLIEFNNKINKEELKKIFLKNSGKYMFDEPSDLEFNVDIAIEKFISEYDSLDDAINYILINSLCSLTTLSEIKSLEAFEVREKIQAIYELNSDDNSEMNDFNTLNEDEIFEDLQASIDSIKHSLENMLLHLKYREAFKKDILWLLLIYIVSFNKFLILLKNKKSFIQNEELYTISINVYNEVIKERSDEFFIYNDIRIKVFPIYENFYADTFDKKLTNSEFGILLYSICKSYSYNELNIEHKVQEKMKKFNLIDILNKTKIDYSDIENIISKIGIHFIDDFYNMYCSIINNCIIKIDLKDLINLYLNYENEKEKIKNLENLKDLEELKNRYLSNDFRKKE